MSCRVQHLPPSQIRTYSEIEFGNFISNSIVFGKEKYFVEKCISKIYILKIARFCFNNLAFNLNKKYLSIKAMETWGTVAAGGQDLLSNISIHIAYFIIRSNSKNGQKINFLLKIWLTFLCKNNIFR
ncbi:hypothetical protein EGR_09287 [Echinococcus granulosus]|uniref:Uncharacterized protein n=1 Tax=Echinococcus granulosus TaxID=6210 RepID=W6U423_ECHGR|nr:hypothetical protein EGR_09287 [Echinococcus granulosus]EUB55845.1 hypothetical protein EGR_09287 [Echinococcus granulosus]